MVKFRTQREGMLGGELCVADNSAGHDRPPFHRPKPGPERGLAFGLQMFYASGRKKWSDIQFPTFRPILEPSSVA
jgi:hypothetical protein